MNVIDLNEDENEIDSESVSVPTLEELVVDDEEVISFSFRGVMKELISLILYLLTIFIIVYLIIHFVGQRTVVSGSSMEDTFSDGDNLIVDKISYFLGDPERFDIVIFPYQYEEDTYYIKRVVGLPGETVFIDADGTIYINGSVLKEDYGTEVITNQGLASQNIVLGEDEYFVLGDNRNNSTDSRFESVGNIKRSDIIGKAWFRMYPFNSIGFVENF